MSKRPEFIFLQPGGYYKLIPPSSAQPTAIKKEPNKITIYTEEKGWHQVDHDWNKGPHHDPDDSDNYDHETDPNTNGRNGDFA